MCSQLAARWPLTPQMQPPGSCSCLALSQLPPTVASVQATDPACPAVPALLVGRQPTHPNADPHPVPDAGCVAAGPCGPAPGPISVCCEASPPCADMLGLLARQLSVPAAAVLRGPPWQASPGRMIMLVASAPATDPTSCPSCVSCMLRAASCVAWHSACPASTWSCCCLAFGRLAAATCSPSASCSRLAKLLVGRGIRSTANNRSTNAAHKGVMARTAKRISRIGDLHASTGNQTT